VTPADHQEWVDAWSEAVRKSSVALGLLDLASARLLALSPDAEDLLAGADQAGPLGEGLVLWVALHPAGSDDRPAVLPEVLERLGRPPTPVLSVLTPRQQEVVARLALGDDVATIASELHLSQSTVRNHLSAAFRRLGVQSQRGLLALLHRD
jgi:DNA-binding CsgD family transcriptional regulator